MGYMARPKKNTTKIPKAEVFSILSAVMPQRQAKVLAGYSEGTEPSKLLVHRETVAEIRERLQAAAGVSLADQVAWYASIRDSDRDCTSDRLNAAKQIDTVLGYNAPQKVELNHNHQIAGALLAIHEIAGKTGLTPAGLRAAINTQSTQAAIEHKQDASVCNSALFNAGTRAGDVIGDHIKDEKGDGPCKKSEARGEHPKPDPLPIVDGTRQVFFPENSSLQTEEVFA